MISAEGDVEDEVVQTAESEGQDVKRVRKRPTRLDFKPEDMGYKGTKLGVRQGGSLRPSGTSLDFPDVSQVARLRGLAAQHADDSELASALQEAAETIELQGVEIEDLKGQLRKFKTMLTQHNTTLMGMEDTECVTDSRILKALQAFILDIMDAAEIPDHAHVGVIGADGKHGAAEMLADVEADAEIEITPKKSKAELAGDQVVDILTKVYRLENQGKMEAARSLRASLPDLKALGESAINKASRDFEDRLFRIGGLNTITTTMERILSRPLIRQVS